MATGFIGTYATRASGETFTFTAAWDRRQTTVKWQANVRVEGRLIDGMSGSIEDVLVECDPTPLVTAMIQRALERLNGV